MQIRSEPDEPAQSITARHHFLDEDVEPTFSAPTHERWRAPALPNLTPGSVDCMITV